MEQVNVALLGLGTVGRGVWKMVNENQDLMARRTGQFFNIRSILVRDLKKERHLEGVQPLLTTEFDEILEKRIDVVIEAMGGVEPARTYLKKAMEKGCHIVTANKELIAKHGDELEVWADKYGVQILFEASVGGGIPVLGTLTNFLQANRIHKISGILNGTTNYILTQMDEKGRSFYEVLNEAQAKGYAEADPTSDIEGHDAAYKLAILIRLAFDAHVPVAKIQRQGIRGVSTLEMRLARSLGFSVKLLAQAEQFGENGPISCFVYPTLIPKEHPLASVNNVYNAIHIEGDYIHDLTLVGQGAGEKPTASAVVEDLCNVIRLKRRQSVRRVEPWVLEGELEAGAQFVLLAIAGAFYDQKWKNHQERLRKRGVQLLTWTTVRDEEYTWLGLIAKGWSDEVKQAVQAEFGWEVKKQIRRPVLLGNQMFPAETKVVHAAISL